MTHTPESEAATGRWNELLAPQQAFATFTVSLGMVLFAFNAFLVSTALPSAISGVGGAELLSWATSLYLIFAIAGGAAAATLMHRMGTRRLFSLGAAAFLVGTLAAGLAPSMPVLLAGRALQGLAAGVIEAGCYVLIPRLFPSRLIPKVFGIEAIAWGMAAFGGPVVAGFLAEAVSWRAAFLAAVPMVLVFWAMVPIVVPPDGGSGEKPVPWFRLAAVACGMLLVTMASILPGNVLKVTVMAFAALVFWVTVANDGRSGPRLFPASAFRLSSAIGLGYWTMLIMPFAQASEMVFLVYALQFLWGYSPLEAGLIASVMSVSWSASQFLQASYSTPASRLAMIWIGPVVLVAGLALVAVALPVKSLGLIVLAQVLVGTGFGMNWSPISQTMMEAAEAGERDATSGLVPTLQAAGYGIGAAFFGVIGNMLDYAGSDTAGLMSDMVLIFVLSALLSAVAVFSATAMVRKLQETGVGGIASPGAP